VIGGSKPCWFTTADLITDAGAPALVERKVEPHESSEGGFRADGGF